MARGTGSNVHIEMGSTPIIAAPFTMAARFKIDDLTHTGVILSIGNKAVANELWGIDVSGTESGDPVRSFAFSPGGFQAAKSTAGPSANTWHHACGVEAANNDRRAFLDGGNKGLNVATRAPSGADEVQIGQNARSTNDGDLLGDVAEAAIWNVALTDAEVAILAKGYSPLSVRPESLVFYMPLVRDIYDVIGAIAFTDFSTTITDHPPIIYPSRGILGAAAAAGGVTVSAALATATVLSPVSAVVTGALVSSVLATATALSPVSTHINTVSAPVATATALSFAALHINTVLASLSAATALSP
ncbi:hypothetical protein LCGC14_2972140, partial [marine sediment metagenome]